MSILLKIQDLKVEVQEKPIHIFTGQITFEASTPLLVSVASGPCGN